MSRINLSKGMICTFVWAGQILIFTIISDRSNIFNGLTECQKISARTACWDQCHLRTACQPWEFTRDREAFASLYTASIPAFWFIPPKASLNQRWIYYMIEQMAIALICPVWSYLTVCNWSPPWKSNTKVFVHSLRKYISISFYLNCPVLCHTCLMHHSA